MMEGLPRPKTSKEALVMKENEIEKGEFENAEFYQQEYESLKNFESVVQLGTKIDSYYDDNQALLKNMQKEYSVSEKALAAAYKSSENKFKTVFNEIKERQAKELDAVLSEWENVRQSRTNNDEIEFEQAMQTAKLLAQNGNFKDAIKVRNAAQQKSTSSIDFTSIDNKYLAICDSLAEKHKAELEKLLVSRRAELDSLDLLKTRANSQTEQAFLTENANLVVNTSSHFKTPLAYEMLAVRPPGKTSSKLFGEDSFEL